MSDKDTAAQAQPTPAPGGANLDGPATGGAHSDAPEDSAASRAADLDYSFPDDPAALPDESQAEDLAGAEALAEDDSPAVAANSPARPPEPVDPVEPGDRGVALEEAEPEGQVEPDEAAEPGKPGEPDGPDSPSGPPAVTEEGDPGSLPAKADDGGDDGGSGGGGNDLEDEEDDEDDEERPGQSIFDHFRELRSRLVRIGLAIVVGFGICWFFHEQIAAIVYRPLVMVLPANQGSSIIFTGVAEGFLTHMKLAIVAGIFLMSPYIFYQIWAFIAPGLYSEEKRFIIPVAMSSGLCFIAGGLFCYFVVFPNAFRFFMTYSEGPFQAMPSMKEYFGFTMQLMIAFGLIFEMPLFCFFLARMGLVKAAAMRRFRRYFIVIAFIVGAFLTPPDPLSQFLMAAPLLTLYELSIIIVSLAGKKEEAPDPDDEEDDPDDEDDEDEDDEDEEDETPAGK